MAINDKTVPMEDAGIILSGLCDFVQGVYDLKTYHIKMQRQFLREKDMTQEELKSIEANDPDKYAIIKAEAKAWLKGQEGFMPNLPRLEKITEKPQLASREKLVCSRCHCEVEEEKDSELEKEYPYYCPECDENLYSFETKEKPAR